MAARLTYLFTFIVTLITLMMSPVHAQSPFSAAYRVNGDVISHYDIDQYTRLLTTIGNVAEGENPREEAVESLINDRLIRQETERFAVDPDDAQIEQALEQIAQGRGVNALRQAAARAGVDNEMLEYYAASQIIWRSYIQTRSQELDVQQAEINQFIYAIPDQVTPVVRVGEIVLPYAEYGGRIPTRLQMVNIREALADGAEFSRIAAQFSRSRSSQSGGVLGDIPLEALTPELANSIQGVPAGGLGDPIETEGAIIMVKVLSRFENRASLPRSLRQSYVELFIPSQPNGREATVAAAQQIALTYPTCAAAEAQIGRFGGSSKAVENVTPASIPSETALELARIQPGDRTLQYKTNGVSILYLCERAVQIPEEFSQIENVARARAIDKRAEGLLLDLRRIAIIEKM